jgi:hypothetical protein
MMHFHGFIARLLAYIVYFLNCVSGIFWGMMAFGYDFWSMPYVSMYAKFIKPAQMVLGAAGVLGIIFVFFACRSHECK